MSSIEDIAAMKMNTIVQNGTRFKDFIDIYFIHWFVAFANETYLKPFLQLKVS